MTPPRMSLVAPLARLAAAAALLVWLPAAVTFAQEAAEREPAPEPRATMQEVFEALVTLLPASLSEDGFDDPERRPALARAFAHLEAGARALALHGEARDADFRDLSRSLADEAEQAAAHFANGHMAEARFGVQLLVPRCIECHSRLPRARDFPLAERLTSQVEITALERPERALLGVVTRDFDAALAAWEATFADPSVTPMSLDLEGHLMDYLSVALRVVGDPGRARRALEALRARGDAPRYLDARLAEWSADLAGLEAAGSPPPTLDEARREIERAEEASDFPGARDGLVHELAASGLLLRLVDRASGTGPPAGANPELAEAFYWLAVLEERMAWATFVPRTEVYLEAAIRAAPGGPRAPTAYERLEEIALSEWSGYEGELPDGMRQRLERLRALAAPVSGR